MYQDRLCGFSIDSHNDINNKLSRWYFCLLSKLKGWNGEARIFSMISFSKSDPTTSTKSCIISSYIGIPLLVEKLMELISLKHVTYWLLIFDWLSHCRTTIWESSFDWSKTWPKACRSLLKICLLWVASWTLNLDIMESTT